MANRNFHRKQALDYEVKELYMSVAIGAAGAPTIDTLNSKGVASITRSSAGLYVVTLQDSYVRLMQAQLTLIKPAAESLGVNLVSSDVVVAKTLTIRTETGGVATDPASGDTLVACFQLKNSSVP